ncbi:MAG: hypothetical protein ABIY37_06395, partial [Devosia sp.]
KSLALAIRAEIKRIKYAGESGIDFTFVHKVIRTALELGVKAAENAKVVPPGTSWAVKSAKVATAFATAYIYGFTVGI